MNYNLYLTHSKSRCRARCEVSRFASLAYNPNLHSNPLFCDPRCFLKCYASCAIDRSEKCNASAFYSTAEGFCFQYNWRLNDYFASVEWWRQWKMLHTFKYKKPQTNQSTTEQTKQHPKDTSARKQFASRTAVHHSPEYCQWAWRWTRTKMINITYVSHRMSLQYSTYRVKWAQVIGLWCP